MSSNPEEANILRMSEHFEHLGWRKHYQAVVTYGWLQRSGEAPRLVPLTIFVQAERGKRVYRCRGQFVNCQVFNSRVKMAGN